MLYQKLTIWMEGGEIWHALRGDPNYRDLSMSRISERDLEKTIAWARMHRMEIEDRRNAS